MVEEREGSRASGCLAGLGLRDVDACGRNATLVRCPGVGRRPGMLLSAGADADGWKLRPLAPAVEIVELCRLKSSCAVDVEGRVRREGERARGEV